MRAKILGVVVSAGLLAGCQTMNAIVGPETKPAEAPAPAPPAAAAIAPGQTLAGMSGESLRSLWGEPTLKRTEPGAELWQYSGSGGCTLLVYVYAGTVTHAEASPGGADEASIAACAKASGKPPLKPVS